MQKILFLFVMLLGYHGFSNTLIDRYITEGDTTQLSKKIIRKGSLSDCEPLIVITLPETNSNYLYWAGNSISVSNNYKIAAGSNADITMKAGKTILLKPNTVIKKGNKYLARIEPCVPSCESYYAYNKSFTPNHDGINDYWTIKDINNITNAMVTIYDRYGKLIMTFNPKLRSWDGKFNNQDMFSSDYWFTFSYNDCYGRPQSESSHFSLVR